MASKVILKCDRCGKEKEVQTSKFGAPSTFRQGYEDVEFYGVEVPGASPDALVCKDCYNYFRSHIAPEMPYLKERWGL